MVKKRAYKLISVFLSLLLTFISVSAGLFALAAPTYWDGTANTDWYNAEDVSFEISTAAQLAGLSQLVNSGNSFDGKIIALTQDVYLNDGSGTLAWTPIGAAGNEFKGTFNGANHTVSGLYISGSADYRGLFGKADYAAIKNVTLNASVRGGDNVGALVGYASYCAIEGCKLQGTVSGAQKVGGIAGSALNCAFLGCTNESTVNGTTYVGGAAGYDVRSTVKNSTNSGAVTGTTDVGGIAGYAVANASVDAQFIACSNSGAVSASTNAGGIAGLTKGYTGTSAGNVVINDCFNTATVTASSSVTGGIVGYCEAYTQLSCCYNTGSISGGTTNVRGGVVGSSASSVGNSSANCFYLSTAASRDALGAANKTAANMTAVSTYSAYGKYVSAADLAVNARNVWIVNAGSYPQLYWQIQQTCTHSYPADAATTVAATCGADGYETYICTICGYVRTDVLAATGEHTYEVTNTQEATCAADGYKTYVCTVCGDTYNEVLAQTTNHTYEYIAADNCLRCSVCANEITSVNGVCGDSATWTLDISGGNNVLTIDGSGEMYDFSSAAAWADYQTIIKSVVFNGAGVSNISAGAFRGATALKAISLPSSCTTIGANAFDGSGLTAVTIPATVTAIGANAFSNCASLAGVTINSLACAVDTSLITGSANAFIYAYCNADFFTACKTAGLRISSLGEHDWIEATCKAAKHCSICGLVEGDKAAHDFSDIRYYSIQAHMAYCTVCGAASGTPVAHSGGTATCSSYAVCAVCNQQYGEMLEHNYELMHNDTQHWYECSLCHDTYGLSNHAGGTATCTVYAKCEVCGVDYGTVSGHSFTILQSDDSGHWYKCTNCTETSGYAEHSGGTATCCRKAACATCNRTYGELDAANHYDLISGATYETYLDVNSVVASTCTTDGFSGNYLCVGCKVIITPGALTEKTGHTGGTATCTQKAVCVECGEEYGELAEHVYNTSRWYTDGTSHWHKCSNPDCTSTADVATHSGGTATCRETAKCEICNTAYGTKNAANHVGGTYTIDQRDSTCLLEGYTGDTVCKGCGVTTVTGAAIAKLSHSGGTATCKAKATCELCGEAYGELNPANHSGGTFVKASTKVAATCTKEGYTGDVCCSGCQVKLTNGTAIAKLAHRGGTATCNEKAICTVCGNAYGEFDPNNHGSNGTTTINAKAKTCTEDGYTGDKVCTGCNKIFEYGQAIPFTGHRLRNVSGSNDKASWNASVCSECDYAKATVTLHAQYSDGAAIANKAVALTGAATGTFTTNGDGYVTLPEITANGSAVTAKTEDGLYTATITIGADGAPAITVDASKPGEEPTTEPTTEPSSGDNDNDNGWVCTCCDKHNHPNTFWGRLSCLFCKFWQLFVNFPQYLK